MPCYSFSCKDCHCSFEISVKKVIDPQQILCVECSSPYVEQEKEGGIIQRLENLTESVRTLTGRVETFDEFFKEITGEGGNDDTGLNYIEIDDDGTRH